MLACERTLSSVFADVGAGCARLCVITVSLQRPGFHEACARDALIRECVCVHRSEEEEIQVVKRRGSHDLFRSPSACEKGKQVLALHPAHTDTHRQQTI